MIFKRLIPKDFNQKEALFDALKHCDDKAIQFVQKKIMNSVASMCRFAQLPEMDNEEILNDTLIILLQKIQSEDYQFQGYDPCSYAIEISKRLISNAKRKQNFRMTETIDSYFDLADDSTEKYLSSKTNENILMSLLNKLGENCQKLIQLKYIDEYKDEEIISQKLTQYNTINVLKVKRSDCMKKLTEIAQNYKKENE